MVLITHGDELAGGIQITKEFELVVSQTVIHGFDELGHAVDFSASFAIETGNDKLSLELAWTIVSPGKAASFPLTLTNSILFREHGSEDVGIRFHATMSFVGEGEVCNVST